MGVWWWHVQRDAGDPNLPDALRSGGGSNINKADIELTKGSRDLKPKKRQAPAPVSPEGWPAKSS